VTIGSTTSLATNTTTSAGGFYFRSLSLWSNALSVCQAQIATALVSAACADIASCRTQRLRTMRRWWPRPIRADATAIC